MIQYSRPEIGSWDHAGGCQACSFKGEINRFVLSSSPHSGGWVVRVCDGCLKEMAEHSPKNELIS